MLQEPYLNKSCPTIPRSFSLHRTYIIFRTLGLRHLTVVNDINEVVGMITRYDAFKIAFSQCCIIYLTIATCYKKMLCTHN